MDKTKKRYIDDVASEFILQLYDEVEEAKMNNIFVTIGHDDNHREYLVVVSKSEYDKLIGNKIIETKD